MKWSAGLRRHRLALNLHIADWHYCTLSYSLNSSFKTKSASVVQSAGDPTDLRVHMLLRQLQGREQPGRSKYLSVYDTVSTWVGSIRTGNATDDRHPLGQRWGYPRVRGLRYKVPKGTPGAPRSHTHFPPHNQCHNVFVSATRPFTQPDIDGI
jgi:hypothetical protein